MKLKISQQPTAVHGDLVGALGWNVSNELYSISDDKTVQKWSMLGEPEGKVRISSMTNQGRAGYWSAGGMTRS